MKIWKFEVLTRKELGRQLRQERKNGYLRAGFELAYSDKVLMGGEAVLRGCDIVGKVVLLGDGAWITHNIFRNDGGISLRVC